MDFSRMRPEDEGHAVHLKSIYTEEPWLERFTAYCKFVANHCQNGVSEMFTNKNFTKETLQGGRKAF